MNYKTAIPLVLAAILGLCAAKVGRDMVLRAKLNVEQGAKMVKVVVATADLEPGHAVSEADLGLAEVPQESRPKTSFADPREVVGRALLMPVVKGQAIVELMVAPAGSGTGPQALIPNGMRAVNVAINEVTGLPGLMSPGSRVDVVSTLQEQGHEAVARTLVQNVKVLAIGQQLSVASKKQEGDLALAKTVTLLVSPREAEMIELAANSGRTRLVLRSPLDNSKPDSRGVTISGLLGNQPSREMQWLAGLFASTTRPAVPAPPQQRIEPAPMPRIPEKRSIEVIRNGAVTKVEIALPEMAPSALSNTSPETTVDGSR